MAKEQVKPGAPGVVVDRSGHRVRLRNISHALEGSISSKDLKGGEIHFRLEPNKWAEVPDEVYSMLKGKFYAPQESEVPDWNGDPNNPQRQRRVEQADGYVIEFPEES